jgi:arylsulfatase A-like enzyme
LNGAATTRAVTELQFLMLPTFAAAAGDPTIKDELLQGVELNGRRYRNHIDGHNMLDYFTGKVKESPRKDFNYVNDDGQVVAIRYDAWKVVFLENRGQAFEVWREPFTELRVPLLFNLRSDPFERAQHNSNTYNDWFLSRGACSTTSRPRRSISTPIPTRPGRRSRAPRVTQSPSRRGRSRR